jgi:hypothetical protein
VLRQLAKVKFEQETGLLKSEKNESTADIDSPEARKKLAEDEGDPSSDNPTF